MHLKDLLLECVCEGQQIVSEGIEWVPLINPKSVFASACRRGTSVDATP